MLKCTVGARRPRESTQRRRWQEVESLSGKRRHGWRRGRRIINAELARRHHTKHWHPKCDTFHIKMMYLHEQNCFLSHPRQKISSIESLMITQDIFYSLVSHCSHVLVPLCNIKVVNANRDQQAEVFTCFSIQVYRSMSLLRYLGIQKNEMLTLNTSRVVWQMQLKTQTYGRRYSLPVQVYI